MACVTWQRVLLGHKSRIFHVDDGLIGPLGQVGNRGKFLLHTFQILIHLGHVPMHVVSHSTCCGAVRPLNTETASSKTFIIQLTQTHTIHMGKNTLFVSTYKAVMYCACCDVVSSGLLHTQQTTTTTTSTTRSKCWCSREPRRRQ